MVKGNMQLVRVTNDNMFTILEGNMMKIRSCTSAKCTNKPKHTTEEKALLTFNVFSLTLSWLRTFPCTGTEQTQICSTRKEDVS